ncbi:hypothetical protein KsCSTR_24260 [Candidatus Kuenenia stuttgartiensis]|uniref:Uncharacterized protein n=1 Tax=Kuenenia stuttgartiensis TaxID=174633 RepID=Q1Q3V7_KUEST|nr:hypothetical protein KsCSTR_24260 [Candidatus Kuenenia stuttgartiensis]CAJ74701.1 unknown protein [Candidatus Kuenenia stuttgartiensis]
MIYWRDFRNDVQSLHPTHYCIRYCATDIAVNKDFLPVIPATLHMSLRLHCFQLRTKSKHCRDRFQGLRCF